MPHKIFAIFFSFSSVISFGQKFYVGGNTETLPNVQLYLDTNKTYNLKIFARDCFAWQFYEGKYEITNDSLILQYQQLYWEPICQIIDTFYRPRTINLLYVDDDNRVTDTLSLFFNHDTLNVDHFPLNYQDTANVDGYRSSITYTFYAPYFKEEAMNIPFYKPKRKIKKTYFIGFKINKNELVIDSKFKALIEPYDKLRLD